jgi:hypothetical protein
VTVENAVKPQLTEPGAIAPQVPYQIPETAELRGVVDSARDDEVRTVMEVGGVCPVDDVARGAT